MTEAHASVVEGPSAPHEGEVIRVTWGAEEFTSDPEVRNLTTRGRTRCLDALRRWLDGEDDGLKEWMADPVDSGTLFQAARAHLLLELAEYENCDGGQPKAQSVDRPRASAVLTVY